MDRHVELWWSAVGDQQHAARERERDHGALEQAADKAGADSPARSRGDAPGRDRASRRAIPGRAAAAALVRAHRGRDLSDGEHGVERVIGSWNTMGDARSTAHSGRMALGVLVEEVVAVEQDGAGGDAAGGGTAA